MWEHYCPTLQSKSWTEQEAQNSVGCLTTCKCQSTRWHKLSCPGYFWCSPFSQPWQQALPVLPQVTCTQGHMHMPGNDRIQQHFQLVFHSRIPAETKSVPELQRQHMKQAYLPGSQEPRVGSWSSREMGPHSCCSTRQLLLSLPGPPRWLRKHSASRREKAWKKENSTGTTSLCCVREEAESCMSCTGSRRLLGKCYPKGEVCLCLRMKTKVISTSQ